MIYYREDFFASALHEVAHWCIAGEDRRAQIDFGYWYEADGRNAEQQQAFYNVEVKPQALELLFSIASGFRFRVSNDNLDGAVDTEASDQTQSFQQRVLNQSRVYLARGLPQRAGMFISALGNAYNKRVDCQQLLIELNTYESLLDEHLSEAV